MKYLLFFALLLTFYGNCMAQEKLEKETSCYVIVFAEPFEKKETGKLYFPQFQLLDICPKREAGLAYQEARITVVRNGKKIETGFDVIKTFADKAEAKEFAQKYQIADESRLLNDLLPKCKIIRVVEEPLRKKSDRNTVPTIALLDTCLSPEAGELQHPMITFEENGKQVSRIFEVTKTFTDQADAEKYARENFIEDIEISEEYKKHIADCRIIRQVQIPLTKKPNVPKESRFALLNTCLNNEIPQQRPVIEVLRHGKKEFREFEIIKIFADQPEAERYAKDNGLPDVGFSR